MTIYRKEYPSPLQYSNLILKQLKILLQVRKPFHYLRMGMCQQIKHRNHTTLPVKNPTDYHKRTLVRLQSNATLRPTHAICEISRGTNTPVSIVNL